MLDKLKGGHWQNMCVLIYNNVSVLASIASISSQLRKFMNMMRFEIFEFATRSYTWVSICVFVHLIGAYQ